MTRREAPLSDDGSRGLGEILPNLGNHISDTQNTAMMMEKNIPLRKDKQKKVSLTARKRSMGSGFTVKCQRCKYAE
jgi:hypothetical protein